MLPAYYLLLEILCDCICVHGGLESGGFRKVMTSVLLLNASFEPLRVISWQRAVTLFFSGKVEVVEEYDHEIHSVSLVIKAPSVVRLLNYINIGRKRPPLSRVNVLARDSFTCQYCAVSITPKNATIDHVLPRSKGGKTSWTNVVCCCKKCNLTKGARTPEQANMQLRTKPRQPDWLPVLEFKLHGGIPNAWQSFLQVFGASRR
jgi:5-methylcytosine-specific restriction endonuclease McrA